MLDLDNVKAALRSPPLKIQPRRVWSTRTGRQLCFMLLGGM